MGSNNLRKDGEVYLKSGSRELISPLKNLTKNWLFNSVQLQYKDHGLFLKNNLILFLLLLKSIIF